MNEVDAGRDRATRRRWRSQISPTGSRSRSRSRSRRTCSATHHRYIPPHVVDLLDISATDDPPEAAQIRV
jgi:hypothetical protein